MLDRKEFTQLATALIKAVTAKVNGRPLIDLKDALDLVATFESNGAQAIEENDSYRFSWPDPSTVSGPRPPPPGPKPERIHEGSDRPIK